MRSEGRVHWQFKLKAKLAPFCGARAPNNNAGPANWTGAVALRGDRTSRYAEGRQDLAAKSLVARGAKAHRRRDQRTRGRRFDSMVGGVEHDHLGADIDAAVEVGDVVIGEADAAGRHAGADGGRRVGAVD